MAMRENGEVARTRLLCLSRGKGKVEGKKDWER